MPAIMDLSLSQRADLRRKVLAYFDKPLGRRAEGISKTETFQNYSRGQVHRMITALHVAGEIEKVSGVSTDTAYRTVKEFSDAEQTSMEV